MGHHDIFAAKPNRWPMQMQDQEFPDKFQYAAYSSGNCHFIFCNLQKIEAAIA